MAKRTAGRRGALERATAILLLAGSILGVFAWAQEEPSREAVQTLERLLAAIEIAASELPRDSFDPQAIIDEVGTEPEALFAWVRDNTFLVPYKGVLRGPVGVLQDRMGNSLDRALLLRDLLRRAGHDAILATGTLSEEEAAELLAAQPRPPVGESAVRPYLSEEQNEDLLARVAERAGLDEAELRAEMEAGRRQAEELATRAKQRSSRQSEALLTAVGSNADTEGRLQALLEHWWVEIQLPTSIVALDPSLPSAELGDTVTAPVSRFSPTSVNQLRGLPDTGHTLVVRVLIERLEDGELHEEIVLEHEIFPAELHGRRIVLAHAPSDTSGEEELLTDKEPWSRFIDLLAQQSEWRPVLLVGDEVIAQQFFSDEGVVKSEPGGDVGAVGGLGGGLFGGFGGAAGAAPGESHLTAEWIEYRINVPGGEPVIERRAVFDLLGPAVRRSAELSTIDGSALAARRPALGATYTEIVPLANRLSGAYLDFLRARSVLATRDLLTALVLGEETPAPVSADLPGFPMVLAQAAQAWGESPLYHDRLSVFTYHYQSFIGEGDLQVVEGFDVVHDGMGGATSSEGFAERLRRGVLVTNAEAFVLDAEGEVHGNAGHAMAVDQESGVEWMVLREPDDELLADSRLPADLVARVTGDLEAGFIVVMPVPSEDPASAGAWWRIDPWSGQTLGFGDLGWGQSLKEYVKTVDKVASSFLCYAGALEGHKSGSDLKTGTKLALCVAGNATMLLKGDRVETFNLVMSLIGKVVGVTGLKAL